MRSSVANPVQNSSKCAMASTDQFPPQRRKLPVCEKSCYHSGQKQETECDEARRDCDSHRELLVTSRSPRRTHHGAQQGAAQGTVAVRSGGGGAQSSRLIVTCDERDERDESLDNALGVESHVYNSNAHRAAAAACQRSRPASLSRWPNARGAVMRPRRVTP